MKNVIVWLGYHMTEASISNVLTHTIQQQETNVYSDNTIDRVSTKYFIISPNYVLVGADTPADYLHI